MTPFKSPRDSSRMRSKERSDVLSLSAEKP
jgi:hypothetical protein